MWPCGSGDRFFSGIGDFGDGVMDSLGSSCVGVGVSDGWSVEVAVGTWVTVGSGVMVGTKV